MDRLGKYLCQFAELLGTENQPVFKGIRRKSTGIQAHVPPERQQNTLIRLLETKHRPDSRLAKPLREIESMLGQDEIEEAQLLDQEENVIYLFKGEQKSDEELIKLYQSSMVDGTVTGVVGADDTIHLHIRDYMARDFKFIIRKEEMARDLLQQFRKSNVRVYAHGWWLQTEQGWIPEANRCVVDQFEILDDDSALDIFYELNNVDGNVWKEMDDPIATWEDIRGIQH